VTSSTDRCKFWRSASGGAAIAALLNPLPGATAGLAPALTNPGLQQQQELQQQQQKQAPNVQPSEPEPLFRETPPGGPSPKGETTLLIRQVRVTGATVIKAQQIESLFEPLISSTARPRPVSFAQLQEALSAATNLYRAQGFFTSRVAVARGGLKEGVLTVTAIEGFLETVEVTGRGPEALKRWTRSYMQPLISRAEQPKAIRLKDLERQLLLMQGFGGVRFNASIAQGVSYGSSKLVIELNPKYITGSIGIDNNVQNLLGNYQVVAQLQANVLSIPQPLQLNLSGGNAFPYPGGLISSAISFATPVGNQGLRLVGLGSYYSTKSSTTPITGVGGAAIALNTSGQSWLGNLALHYPLLLSRRGSLSMSLSAEAQNATSNTYLDEQLALSNPSRLRVLRLGVDGSWATPFYASSATLQVSQGLPIASAYDAATLAQSGGSLPSGSVSFTSARLNLRHQQRLGSGNTFLTAIGSGQLTATTLPTPEDFSYGGPWLGRAYRSVYLAGDQGAAAGLELSHRFSRGTWNLTPFVFGDYGVASNNGNIPTPFNYNASSYGIGLRGGWGSATSFEVGWGIPSGSYPEATGMAGVTNSIVYARARVAF